MKRVKITNHIKNEKFGADFEDPTQWIAQEVANNSWGLPERWLPDTALSPLSEEEKAKATETRVIQNDLGEEVTEYFFPAEYTIEIEDITAQVELEAEQGEARRYLNETDWMIIRELEGGKKVPSKVKDSRAEARLKLSKDLEASEDKASKGLIKRVLEALGIG